MKNIYIWVVLLITCFGCQKQNADIAGQWEWEFTNDYNQTHQVTVLFKNINENKVVGFYCSSFGNGTHVDCAKTIHHDDAIPNFELTRISSIQFNGTFRSNRAEKKDKNGIIEVTYFAATGELFFDMQEEPTCSFYFPDEVRFNKQ